MGPHNAALQRRSFRYSGHMKFMRWIPTSLIMSVALLNGVLMAPLAHGDSNAVCGAGDPVVGSRPIAVISSGKVRSVLLYVPPAATTHRPLPLIIDLHGSGSNGEEQAKTSRFSDLAAKDGFVVANPSGGVVLPGAPDAHYWNIPGVPLTGGAPTPTDAPDDVQFINDTIDTIASKSCIDPRRIYVTGMSGGARMASLLACRLSARIAAIAPVSGLRAGLPSSDNPSQPDPATCQPQRAVPIVTFHGTGDTVNPYSGDSTPRWHYSVPAALARWVEIDHCQGKPQDRRVAAHVTLVRYGPCEQGAEIWLYRTDATGEQGGGHAWPGSVTAPSMARNVPAEQLRLNVPSTEIDASELIWQFFKAHSLPVEGKKVP
jgi:polyhydroxybutyrate depolymerase